VNGNKASTIDVVQRNMSRRLRLFSDVPRQRLRLGSTCISESYGNWNIKSTSNEISVLFAVLILSNPFCLLILESIAIRGLFL